MDLMLNGSNITSVSPLERAGILNNILNLNIPYTTISMKDMVAFERLYRVTIAVLDPI